MRSNHVLSSLCYFSILFAPLLFPIIVLLIATDEVKVHAKKALWTHLIPCLSVVIGLAISAAVGFGVQDIATFGIGLFLTYAAFILTGVYYFFWNIVKGVRVLNSSSIAK
ncbi:DUF4870 domain-containing protein [Paenibacillus sp. MER TA 81-3]|uniref:DUF4870 domain-containing protein n=1 Tax=Paenibacillus sp. MER TA 81-3 TaxID=2939573 RepID=UPI00203ABA34|nr:DUF4870 domain-containing protein [Paenibacillus sp. MER TA 81-3]MCM3339764.1 DUF4870 domain-containing protein [Paenibacillus sp. MER TA 81-3]